jgi:hypothetical protein
MTAEPGHSSCRPPYSYGERSFHTQAAVMLGDPDRDFSPVQPDPSK